MKRIKTWHPLAVCAIAFGVIVFTFADSFGGTYYWHYEKQASNQGMDLDSLRVMYYYAGDSAGTIGADSIYAFGTGSFPVADSLGLDSTKGYVIWEFVSYDGIDGYGEPDRIAIPAISVAATAVIDLEAIADTVDGILTEEHGPGLWTAGGSGTGTHAQTVLALNVSGVDTTIITSGIRVQVKNQALSGAPLWYGTTDENGVTWGVINDGDYAIMPFGGGYSWTVDSTTISGAPQTDTIYGAATSPTPPSGDNTCTVWGFLYRADALVVDRYTPMTFTPTKIARDTCNETNIFPQPIPDETDSIGYFSHELSWSSCTDGMVYEWRVAGYNKTMRFTVPDTTSYELEWTDE